MYKYIRHRVVQNISDTLCLIFYIVKGSESKMNLKLCINYS
ncbi:hypothetical protein CNEO4_100003 [Clostridium neonatale]|uniref:Uncharacterized protein n=1 Tax=Clostridium neonatale TaxID=137838 RepID=A0AAD1YD21_9CLOT|nr:hypothetical protein CNEO_40160 [Clostridium neonatale]CAI3194537.1 hypothetical protein CNEO2_130036 [Clostridium neonatale]CAI3197739.1 hypothetical protein CNEO2_230030 [Clostridium neonatale]CAI3198728.1 hypothetical protein CNEO2_180036 [Clostridium neonatale]CAI3212084.1 hypothetical protein CNEO2_40162 [Clostridium neonatale]